MTKMAASLFKNLSNCRSLQTKICQTNANFFAFRNTSFKSQYSLDKIYPQSSLNITKDVKIPSNEGDTFSGYIPIDQLTITYSASSGPGGQNVNKVHTKVDLRFHVESAKWIPEFLRLKLSEKYKAMINKEGYLIIRSERTRFQALNLADCMDKLRFMVREANKPLLKLGDEEITGRLERHEAAARERLRVKRIRSQIKQDRRDSD